MMRCVASSSKRILSIKSQIPIPRSNDQVLIKVHSVGINRPDLMQVKGLYPPPIGASNILGLEISGTIESGTPAFGQKIGDSVCVLVTGGGYADYCLADAKTCLPIPTNLNSNSFNETMTNYATLPEATTTVWQNLFSQLPQANSVNLLQGETLLVHGGTSGIGSFAIQLAKAQGCTVIATCGSDVKVKACVEQLGADVAFNYRSGSVENKNDWESQVKQFMKTKNKNKTTTNGGVDVILDIVGGKYLQKNINVLNTKGRLRTIGFMKGPKSEINMTRVLLKQLSISGSVLRSQSDELKRQLTNEIYENVWPMIEDGRIKPVVHKVFDGLDRVKDAHALMETSDHIGKIAIKL